MSEEQNQEASDFQVLYSAIGFIGVILIFALILIVAYLPKKETPVDHDLIQKRKATLQEVQAKQQTIATSYDFKVENNQKIVTRIPIERAKELLVKEFKVTNP